MHFFLVLALGVTLIFSFQNCGRGEFKTISSSLSSQANPGTLQACSSNTLNCETDTGYGKQICTQISPQSISLGLCILDSCKTGLTLINGDCVDTSCPSGTYLIGNTCGVCTGTTQYDSGTRSCVTPPPPKVCTFNGKTLQIGEKVTAYNLGSVSGSDICANHKETRTCVGDNNLSGSYTYASCGEAPPPPLPKTCTFNGKTLQYGEQVKAYNLSAVYGSDMCANHQEIRTCYGDNNLSGSYPYASCSEPPPVMCLFGGKTIQLGEEVAAYSQASAPGSDICANHKEMRKCIGDNVLSGSYPYASCIDDNLPPPVTCPAGLSSYVDMNGKQICAYYCPLYLNSSPAFYKCPNGVQIIVSACPGGVTRTGIYMSSIPKANATYMCNASDVYP